MAAFFQGPGVWTALGLNAVLVLLLPAGLRRRALQPLAAVALAFLFVAMGEWLADHDLPVPFEYVALFFLLCSIGRSLVLLFTKAHGFQWVAASAPTIVIDLTQGLIFLAAFAFTLNAAGVDPASLVAGSALITAAIGLSMKDTLGNLFAGLALQTERPFDVGDWIQFDQQPQHVGRVLEINWRATKVITLDEVIVVVPNSQLAQTAIRVFTKPELHSRRSIYLVAPYDVSTQRVQSIVLDAVRDAWGVLQEPAPSVVTNAFTERGIEYWVRVFTSEFDRRDRVDGAVRDRIWYALRREGISLPVMQHQVKWQEMDVDHLNREQQRGMEERRAALQDIDFLDELPGEALDRLAATARQVHYAAGEVIIREGAPGDSLYIINRGEVEVTKSVSGCSAVKLDRLGPHKFFGETSLLTGEPRSATVTAVQECDVFVIDRASLAPILSASPNLADHISEVLAMRLGHQAEQIELATRQSHATLEDPDALLTKIKTFFSLWTGAGRDST